MALFPCSECGNPVSDQAKKCPKCGAKTVVPRHLKKTSPGVMVLAILIGIGVVSAMFRESPPEHKKTAKEVAEEDARSLRNDRAVGAAKLLRDAMKDPESFSVQSALIMESGAVCYEYRAKNSFAAVVPGMAVLTAKGGMIATGGNERALDKAWREECAGKMGRDVSSLIGFSL